MNDVKIACVVPQSANSSHFATIRYKDTGLFSADTPELKVAPLTQLR